jgi:hypothetical protein
LATSSRTSRLRTSTPLRDFMKQIERAPSRTSSASSSAASPSAERRAPDSRSVSGGFQIAILRCGLGEPSSSISAKSSRPVRRSASSTGLAIVAEAIMTRGSVP